MLGQISKK